MKVTPVLGFISVEGGTLDDAKPANNATRWIFNVEGLLAPEGRIVVSLLDPRNKKPIKPDIVSCSFLPLSGEYYEAKPFLLRLSEGEPGTFALKHAGGPVTAYRVQVDIMHTATR